MMIKQATAAMTVAGTCVFDNTVYERWSVLI